MSNALTSHFFVTGNLKEVHCSSAFVQLVSFVVFLFIQPTLSQSPLGSVRFIFTSNTNRDFYSRDHVAQQMRVMLRF
jgi:hypothetical protein